MLLLSVLCFARGASLQTLGPNLGLTAACFHGHWRLCLLLLEHGANVNDQSGESKETPLHASLCSTDRTLLDRVVEVLLSRGADPNLPAAIGVETEGFMRDARTKGETPLHRAAAFGEEETVKMLLDAGARRETRDANGDTPLSWASWYLRPASILHQLCYGEYRVNPGRKSMRANLIGFPRTKA
jgi:ankyrin repeat protein